MKAIVRFIIALLLFYSCKSSTEKNLSDSTISTIDSSSDSTISNIDSSQIYVFVDSWPTMPDGSNIFMGIRDIIHQNLHYPNPDSLECGIVGRITLELIVKYDGSIINKKVSNPYNSERCETDYKKIREAFMMALDKIPKCKPGIKDGKYVSVKFLVPAHIDLQ